MTLPETSRAAFVIARRDFTATVFSKTFLLFLLGPLFPVAMGVMFGGIGNRIDSARTPPQVAVIAPLADFRALDAARDDERGAERFGKSHAACSCGEAVPISRAAAAPAMAMKAS